MATALSGHAPTPMPTQSRGHGTQRIKTTLKLPYPPFHFRAPVPEEELALVV
jgi:hypothetical protein